MSLQLDVRQFTIAHHIDCGIALMRCNRHAQAVIEFETVLQMEPENRYARWNRALAYLSLGNYEKGMPEHDWAWTHYKWHSLGEEEIKPVLALPEWKGERCKLIVYHEMGFGDAIMCLRFLADLVKRCQSVTLVVRPELVTLFNGYGATVVSVVPQEVAGFDARVSLFNSIWVAGWCHSISPKPYIRMQHTPIPRSMGIVWSGNSQKNFSLKSFLANLETEGFELYALQKTDGDPGRNVNPLPDGFDFLDTAHWMRTMEIIVSIDTAAVHLAGAIGHPNTHFVTPYLRDWRWWHIDRWYETLHCYSQDTPESWDGPFDKVNAAINHTRAQWASSAA